MDLYGGGGLVSNMPDLMRFFKAMFDGRLFDNPQTLQAMRTSIIPDHDGPMYPAVPSDNKSDLHKIQYCLGIYASEYRGYTIFQHGGFWGTLGGYLPAIDLAFGVAVTEQKSLVERKELLQEFLDVVIEYSNLKKHHIHNTCRDNR